MGVKKDEEIRTPDTYIHLVSAESAALRISIKPAHCRKQKGPSLSTRAFLNMAGMDWSGIPEFRTPNTRILWVSAESAACRETDKKTHM